MDKSTYEVRFNQWKAIITECQNRPADQTVKQWTAENGINEKQYYYWLRKIRKAAFEEMNTAATSETRQVPACSSEVTFTEVRPANACPDNPGHMELISPETDNTSAVISTGKCSVHISNGISPALLRQILEVVIHA